MKPLIVLLVSFVITLGITKLTLHYFDFTLSGRIAMSIMLVFTAMAHFAFTTGMEMMIPGFIPFKRTLVYLTGAIEICAAVGLLISNLQLLTGWLLILFFLLILPVNINAAFKHIDYQQGTFKGAGPGYLWFRVPLQLLFILWTYFSAIRY